MEGISGLPGRTTPSLSIQHRSTISKPGFMIIFFPRSAEEIIKRQNQNDEFGAQLGSSAVDICRENRMQSRRSKLIRMHLGVDASSIKPVLARRGSFFIILFLQKSRHDQQEKWSLRIPFATIPIRKGVEEGRRNGGLCSQKWNKKRTTYEPPCRLSCCHHRRRLLRELILI